MVMELTVDSYPNVEDDLLSKSIHEESTVSVFPCWVAVAGLSPHIQVQPQQSGHANPVSES